MGDSFENTTSVSINISKFVFNGTYNFTPPTDTPDICELRQMYHKDLTQFTSVAVTIVCAYIIVIILAILGNILVIWTVWRNSHMHTVTNYYIVNLAISDLLVASIVMPLKLLEYTADCDWQVFSDGLCSVLYYLLPIFVFASVLTLVAISIERYYAIVHPLSAMKVNSKSRTRKIIAGTWVIPVIVASPFVFCQSYAFTIYSENGSISRQICNDRFNEIDMALYGNDPSKNGEFRKGYFLFLFCVIYLIPSVVILTTCIKIAISLVQPITADNSMFGRKETSRRHEENKRKVARMVVVIAITFIASWSPQYIVSIVSQLQKDSFLRENNFIFTMLITHFFGFVNSCLNPIIYTAMSQKFRRSFKDIMRRICFCCSFRTLVTYSPTQGRNSCHRFTSTLRQTMSDTEGNHIALNDTVCPSDSFYSGRGNKNNSRSSSSGNDSDIRSYKGLCSNKNIIRKYIFKTNGQTQSVEESDKPLISESVKSSPGVEIKGILKMSPSDKHIEDGDCINCSNNKAQLVEKSSNGLAKGFLAHNEKQYKEDKANQNSLCIMRDNNTTARVLYTAS